MYYPDGPSVIQGFRSRREKQKGGSKWFDVSRTELAIADFDNEGGYEPKKWTVSRSRKDNKRNFLLGLL